MLTRPEVTPLEGMHVPRDSNGEPIDADTFVAQRDLAHDAARQAADLAAAPAADRKRLDEEQARLVKLQEAVVRAGNATHAARDGIVDARMIGKSDSQAMAAFDAAEKAAERANWDANLQGDVVRKLRERILAAVQVDQEAKATAALASARELYRAALARLVPVYDAIAALAEAHAAEVAAGDQLAYARHEYWTKFDEHGLRERRGPRGAPYLRTPDPLVAIVLNGEPIAGGRVGRTALRNALARDAALDLVRPDPVGRYRRTQVRLFFPRSRAGPLPAPPPALARRSVLRPAGTDLQGPSHGRTARCSGPIDTSH